MRRNQHIVQQSQPAVHRKRFFFKNIQSSTSYFTFFKSIGQRFFINRIPSTNIIYKSARFHKQKLFGGENIIDVDVNDLIFRKITLKPTFAEPSANFPVATQLLKDGLVDADMIVSHTFGFDNAAETMKAIVDGSEPVIKAVFLPHGRKQQGG